tara:strand:+ start:653 stop:4597 length:3945 start_codon:yes stop_codon:yes gene_type:complete
MNENKDSLVRGIRAYHEGQYKSAVDILQPLADNGEVEAALYIGLICFDYKQFDKAISWLEPIAEEKHPEALHYLGEIYNKGLGVDIDTIKASKLFQEAMDMGYVNSKVSMALQYYNGDGVEQDYKKAIKLLEESSSQKAYDANYFLGMIYYFGIEKEKDKKYNLGLDKNTDYGFQLLESASKNNVNEASRFLAREFKNKNNSKKYLHYLHKAADNTDGNAQFQLAREYAIGNHTKKNLDEAEKYAYFSAFKSVPGAKTQLAMIIQEKLNQGAFSGEGLEDIKLMEEENIIKYLKGAIEENDSTAMHRMGLFYLEGTFVQQDYNKAMNLFEKSAFQFGNEESYHSLGIIYLQGQGVDLNKETALKNFIKAADLGLDVSQLNVGLMYKEKGECEIGGSTDQDDYYEKAAHYFKLAADQNNHTAMFEFAHLVATNVITKNVKESPFNFYTKEDYFPGLQRLAEYGDEHAKKLINVILSIEAAQEITKKDNIILDKEFKVNKIKKFNDLNYIFETSNLYKFLLKNINKNLDLLSLIQNSYKVLKISPNSLFNYLNDKFNLKHFYDQYWIEKILNNNKHTDLTRIMSIQNVNFQFDINYYILNFIKLNQQFIFKTTGSYDNPEKFKFKIMHERKKYTPQILKKLFQSEQEKLKSNIKSIWIHPGINPSSQFKNNSLTNEYNFFVPLTKKVKDKKIAIYLLEDWVKKLPMSKKDILKYVKNNSYLTLNYHQQAFLDDKEIVLPAVRQWGWNIQFASKRLQSDDEVKIAAKKSYIKDKSIAVERITEHGFVNIFDQMCIEDKNIVLPVMHADGFWYNEISQRLKKDREIALAACNSWAMAFKDLPNNFKKNRDFIKTALNRNTRVFEFIPKKLLNKSEILSVLIKDPTQIRYAPNEFKGDKKIIIKLCKINSAVIKQNISKKLLVDKDIVANALKNFCYDDEDTSYGDREFNNKAKIVPNYFCSLFVKDENGRYKYFNKILLKKNLNLLIKTMELDFQVKKIREKNGYLRGEFDAVIDFYINIFYNLKALDTKNLTKIIKFYPEVIRDNKSFIEESVYFNNFFCKKYNLKSRIYTPKNFSNDYDPMFGKKTNTTCEFFIDNFSENHSFVVMHKTKVLKEKIEIQLLCITELIGLSLVNYILTFNNDKNKNLITYSLEEINKIISKKNKKIIKKNKKTQIDYQDNNYYLSLYSNKKLIRKKIIKNFKYSMKQWDLEKIYINKNKSKFMDRFYSELLKDVNVNNFTHINSRNIIDKTEVVVLPQLEKSNRLITKVHNTFSNTYYINNKCVGLDVSTILLEKVGSKGIPAIKKWVETITRKELI